MICLYSFSTMHLLLTALANKEGVTTEGEQTWAMGAIYVEPPGRVVVGSRILESRFWPLEDLPSTLSTDQALLSCFCDPDSLQIQCI